MIYIVGFIVAMLLTMVLMPSVKHLGYRFDLVDIPDKRKVHATPIPRIGGVAIVLGASVPLMIWLDLNPAILGYLFGSFIILLFGLLDDRYELNYKLKFGAQILASIVAVVYGGIHFEQIWLLDQRIVFPEPVAIVLTCFFILTAINAINFSDGLDGLAGGVVLLSLSAIIVLALRVGATEIVLICAVLAGSLLGFLLFNSHPAQIFMGDSGSQFLGFSLGVLTLHLVYGRSDLFSTLFPLAIIGLPIADVFLVIVSRLIQKRSPFKPDNNHIHHRLMSLGLRQYGSVSVIYIIQATIILVAMLHRYNGDMFYILYFPSVVLAITSIMLFVEKYDSLPGVRYINTLIRTPENSLRKVKRLIEDFDLARWSRLVAISLIVGYLLLGAMAISPVTSEVGMIAAALFVLFLIFQPVQITEKLSGWFIRFIYYLSVSGILFLVYTTPGLVEHFKPHMDVLFVLLALLIIIGIEYSDDTRLNAKPFDFLLIVVAFILSGISGNTFGGQLYWIVAVHLLVIFYGVELILIYYRDTKALTVIQLLFALPLAVLVVRGFLF